MTQKKLSLIRLLELIEMEAFRGIINKNSFLQAVMKKGIPRVIKDVRGAVRLAVEREGEDFLVTEYSTELARETVGQIY